MRFFLQIKKGSRRERLVVQEIMVRTPKAWKEIPRLP